MAQSSTNRSSKRKRLKKSPSLRYHRNFRLPSDDDREDALGPFPLAPFATESRRAMILEMTPEMRMSRPSLQDVDAETAFHDLNRSCMYNKRSCKALPPQPEDELDWLVQVHEEGQSVAEYLRCLTSRSGRLRPMTHAKGQEILLLPIIHKYTTWKGPSLHLLTRYSQCFFDRPVMILDPAILTVKTPNRALSQPGVFADKARFHMQLPRLSSNEASGSQAIAGRYQTACNRFQLQVKSLLQVLSQFRGLANTDPQTASNFSVVGVTMEDLFDGPRDVFCAGMANPAEKVAVFSFHRYHPHLKMHPQTWHRYGYAAKSSTYSYMDTGAPGCDHRLQTNAPEQMSAQAQKTLLHRSSKLLTHEIAHLYGLAHCVYYSCLMNGTAHLVEDFRAPMHLCPICLRKLQWRLGFSVAGRYQCMNGVYHEMKLHAEAQWTRRRQAEVASSMGK